MILRTSPPSPFGRMVKIAIEVQGMADQLTVQAADTNDPNDNLRQQNPLGKIPILLVGDDALYDTRVILDYLELELFLFVLDIKSAAIGIGKAPGFADDHLQEIFQPLLGRQGHTDLDQFLDPGHLTFRKTPDLIKHFL